MNNFKKTDIRQIKGNPVEMIGHEWFLLTAGTFDNFNTMTAAWGGIGYLWNKPVVFCFIRPTRHTYNYFEKSDLFSLTFFDSKFKDILSFCGSKSGRDTDKIAHTGLIPIATEEKSIIFDQARLAFICRKIYRDDIKPSLFLDPSLDKLYNDDYHRMYIGEVIATYEKK